MTLCIWEASCKTENGGRGLQYQRFVVPKYSYGSRPLIPAGNRSSDFGVVTEEQPLLRSAVEAQVQLPKAEKVWGFNPEAGAKLWCYW